MKLSKNLKVIMPSSEGDLVVEFKRISNKERNVYYAEQLNVKSEGAKKGDDLDKLRIDVFDRLAESVSAVMPDGTIEPLTDDEDKPLSPADLPEDIKTQAVISILETNRVHVKNF